MTLRAALLTLPLIAAACGAKLAGPGEPCQTTADCQDGLECHLHDGGFAVLFGVVEFVDDLPKLAFRLLDEAVHAVAGVQQEGDLHQGLVIVDGAVFDFVTCCQK
jgi:hypothetical protein